MERDLTLKEKIQIYMKNRKEITFTKELIFENILSWFLFSDSKNIPKLFNLLILSLILCFTYMFLDIIF